MKASLLAVWTTCAFPAFAATDPIKAFCLDFNWGPGGPNGFAKPGLWADADPARHVAWYRGMGANVIQTFCVSCNGHAWYKSGVVPEQPGLKHDFLREVVKGAHRDGMRVLGYFCAGSNTRWGREHPQLSYGIPSEPHIPYTDEYLAYLDAAIRDAVGQTGMDGFMLDWLRMPTTRASNGGRWLECEKRLYAQLMGEPFPGEKELPAAQLTEYGRRAVDRCWGVVRKAAKETNPNCLVWLTCCDVNDPHIINSRALRETDWLLNEAGDLQRTADAKRMIGPHTRLITCLANWNQQDPMQIVPAALKEGIGLYGFSKPGPDSLLPLEAMLARPVSELKGDEKNIAVLARAFHGVSLDSVRTSNGRFISGGVVPQTPPPSSAAHLARPSPQQYAWHEQERIHFVCLDPCTWQGREYDNHSTPLSAINPTQLDTDQWCRAAKLWGAKEILFVAKHTGGFCWWRTDTTPYGIKDTAWKGGQGDVLAELSASCRKHALTLGIYVYPGDDTWGAPMGSGGRTKDPAKQDAYNKVFRRQLTEVLTRYGAIAEVWFDGSCAIDVSDILKQHAADAVIFQGPQATIRWPGTESGRLPYPAWNALLSKDLKTGTSTAAHGNPDGDAWAPLEADTTLYDHNWFWSAANEKKRKGLDELMDIYYKSAGRGGVLLLNSTPNTNGLIPDGDLELYQAFGREIERRFNRPVAEAKDRRGSTVELPLPRPTLVNHAVIMEDYRAGERIREYVVEGLSDGRWSELKKGTSVGRQKIDLFRSVPVSRVRLRVTKSAAPPIIRRFAAFHVEGVSAGSLTTGRHTTASVFHSEPYLAAMATDDNPQTRWGCPDGTTACWLEVDLDAPTEFGRIAISELADRIRKFTLQYRNDTNAPWQSALEGARVGARFQRDFPAVTGRYVRLNITEASGPPTLWEFHLHPGAQGWQRCGGWTAQSFRDGQATFTLDLSPFITKPGQFEVKFEQTDGQNGLRIAKTTLLYEGEAATPGLLTRLPAPNTFNVSRTAQVTQETSSALRVELTADGGTDCEGVVRIRPRPSD